MSTPKLKNLCDVRERLLGYSLSGVARMSGIPIERLRKLESLADAPTVSELETLSLLYGIDADLLGEAPIRIGPKDVVSTLASSDEFREIGDEIRRRVVAAASAARDMRKLQRLLDIDTDIKHVSLRRPRINDAPYAQGTYLASLFRKQFNLGTDPIPSMKDLVRSCLPKVNLLYSRLTPQGPAGLSFAGKEFGPAIVINLDGRNRNACVRRFSLAHEVCHITSDWVLHGQIAQLSGYDSDAKQDIERRANAFAVRLLCPESVIDSFPRDQLKAAGTLIDQYGLHYGAARLYLLNLKNYELPPQIPVELNTTGTEQKWELAETPDGISNFPIDAVPTVRRTNLARLASTAYQRGKIQRDVFARFLRVPPTEELEVVLDFFGLDQPEQFSESAA